MRSTWVVGCLLVAGACAGPQETPEVSDAPPRDNPAECVDQKAPFVPFGEEEREAAAKMIPALTECAATLEKPANVLAAIVLRTDGSVEQVLIRRASTADCKAIECVRR